MSLATIARVMNTPVPLVAAIIYPVVAMLVAGFAVRWFADNWGRATGEITPSVVALAFGVTMLWPLSLVPFVAYVIARGRCRRGVHQSA